MGTLSEHRFTLGTRMRLARARLPPAYGVEVRVLRRSGRDLALLALGLALLAAALVPILLGRPRLLEPIDLVVYRTAGRAALHGWSLYAPSFLAHSGGHLPFTYPPFAAIVLVPLAILPLGADYVLWSAMCLVALWALVRLSFGRLLARCPARFRVLVVLGLTAAAALTVPVAEHLTLGQVGIPLTLLCVADVLPARTRWPRGLLVGVATAIKLTPGLFVAYFLLTRQWRAAATSAATTAAAWLVAAAVMPAGSWRYFVGGVGFDPSRAGAVTEVANQSLWGTTHRWWGSAGELPWLCLALAVLVVGLHRARLAERSGNRLAAASLVGVTSLLVSPVSWMHTAAWLVPALAALVGDGRRLRRAVAALAVWVVLLLLVPHPAPSVATGLDGWYVKFVLHESLVYVYLAILFLLPVGDQRRARIRYPSMVTARV